MKKEGLYSLHSTQLVCELHSYPIFLAWDACTVQCMYFIIYMFFFLNCSHSSYLKIKLSANFLNP
jgi:hypothetical protein